MMKQFVTYIAVVAAVILGMGIMSPTVGAVDLVDNACSSGADTVLCQNQNETINTVAQPIIETILLILGVLAVIMIIVGGILYILSAGDPGKAKKAKDTILYAVIGLVVAMLAYAIVSFVVGQF